MINGRRVDILLDLTIEEDLVGTHLAEVLKNTCQVATPEVSMIRVDGKLRNDV